MEGHDVQRDLRSVIVVTSIMGPQADPTQTSTTSATSLKTRQKDRSQARSRHCQRLDLNLGIRGCVFSYLQLAVYHLPVFFIGASLLSRPLLVPSPATRPRRSSINTCKGSRESWASGERLRQSQVAVPHLLGLAWTFETIDIIASRCPSLQPPDVLPRLEAR